MLCWTAVFEVSVNRCRWLSASPSVNDLFTFIGGPECLAFLTGMSDCVRACFFQSGALFHIFRDQNSSNKFPWIHKDSSGIEAEITLAYPHHSLLHPAELYITRLILLTRPARGWKAPWQTPGHSWNQWFTSCFQCGHLHQIPVEAAEAPQGLKMLVLGVVWAADCVNKAATSHMFSLYHQFSPTTLAHRMDWLQ